MRWSSLFAVAAASPCSMQGLQPGYHYQRTSRLPEAAEVFGAVLAGCRSEGSTSVLVEIEALKGLATVERDSLDLPMAEGHLLQAHQLAPDDTAVVGDLAVLWAELGRLEDAISILSPVVTSGLAGPTMRFNLARMLHVQGRLDEALDVYMALHPFSAVELPEHRELVVALALLTPRPELRPAFARLASARGMPSSWDLFNLCDEARRVLGLGIVNHAALILQRRGSEVLTGAYDELYGPLITEDMDECAESARACPTTNLTLVVEWFEPRTQGRKRELQVALARNLLNPYIDRVVVLSDGPADFGIDVFFATEEASAAELVHRVVGGRATFQSALRIADELARPADVAVSGLVIANCDIVFDATLSLVHTLLRGGGLGERTLTSLLRWELPPPSRPDATLDERLSEVSRVLQPRIDSQDAWLVGPDFVNYISDEASAFDELGRLEFGRPGVDNRLTKLVRQAGVMVRNLGLLVRGTHLHADARREYTSREHVLGELDHALLDTSLF